MPFVSPWVHLLLGVYSARTCGGTRRKGQLLFGVTLRPIR